MWVKVFWQIEGIAMKPEGYSKADFRLLAIAFLLCALPVAIFWRPHLFFIADDWTALWLMSQHPLAHYLTLPDGEQWFPLFHLVFYSLIKVFGEHYSWMVLINCLGTGLNAFLLYLFYRRHFSDRISLVLSLIYALAAVHYATIWMAFYICYILSLTFFLSALLLTDRYLRSPSFPVLLGIGLCSGASVLSHNYSLLALLAIPLYPVLVRGRNRKRAFWALSSMVFMVLLGFTVGYLHFAGAKAAEFHNREILSRFPGLSYLYYWFLGSFSYPMRYTFSARYLAPARAFLFSLLLLGPMAAIIIFKGKPEEKGLALWALLLNALPMLLVALARHQMPLQQAGSERYGVLTLVGALFLVGIAWTILARTVTYRPAQHSLLALGVLTAIILSQLLPSPDVLIPYREWNRQSIKRYSALKAQGFRATPEEAQALFLPGDHPWLTWGQAIAIHRYLEASR